MKKSTPYFFSLVVFFLALMLLAASCKDKMKTPVMQTVTPKDLAITVQIPSVRESITFILGKDKTTKNPYYTEALKYYTNNNSGKTTYLTTNILSLLEVRDYLEAHSPSNKLPWGTINLVVHGEQWLGLSIKIIPGGKRATIETINECLDKGLFKAFSDSVIDEKSIVSVHACGVGNNKEFVQILGKVFKAKSSFPTVIATKLFENYTTVDTGKGGTESQEYLSEAYIIAFKMDSVPAKATICNMLHNKYPAEKVNWSDAITRKNPRWIGDVYHYTFQVPVSFVIKVNKDSFPDISDYNKAEKWIEKQSQITESLDKIEIPTEQFSWKFQKVFVRNEANKKVAAIKVSGFCTMFCVLKPLIVECNKIGLSKPLVPSLTNEKYYYTVNGKKL